MRFEGLIRAEVGLRFGGWAGVALMRGECRRRLRRNSSIKVDLISQCRYVRVGVIKGGIQRSQDCGIRKTVGGALATLQPERDLRSPAGQYWRYARSYRDTRRYELTMKPSTWLPLSTCCLLDIQESYGELWDHQRILNLD